MFVPFARRVAFGLPTATRNQLLSTTCKKFNTVDASKNIQPFVQEIHPEKAARIKHSAENIDSIDWDQAAVVEADSLSPKVTTADKVDLHRKLPLMNPTYSLASVVNEHPTLQKLVDLGVDLSQWEESEAGGAGLAIGLDFERDVAPRIHFFVDLGVKPKQLGSMFTRNPGIFKTELHSLKTRVDYLKWKKFSNVQVRAILLKCPEWLNHTVTEVDLRLGYFQNAFHLTGDQVRQAAARGPELIVWKGVHMAVERVRHPLQGELEFTQGQVKHILLKAPSALQRWDEDELRETVGVLTKMYTRQVILHNPKVLALEKLEVRTRHEFLIFLGKAVYDPTKANYVPPESLLVDDETFCSKYAKVPLQLYHKFLLTV